MRRSLYNRDRYIYYYTIFRDKRYPHWRDLFQVPFQEKLIRLMSHGSFNEVHKLAGQIPGGETVLFLLPE